MRASIFRLALPIVLGLGACGNEPIATTDAVHADDTIIDAWGTAVPTVRVLDEGREPRHPLARAPIASERNVEITVDIAPLGYPADAPMTMRLAVTWSASVADKVPWRFAVRRGEVSMPHAGAGGGEQMLVDAMATFYAQIGGHARELGPAHLEVAQTKGMTSQPAVPWLLHLFALAPPVEPLGPGAKWTTQSETELDAQRCTEQRAYEIISVDTQQILSRLVLDFRCEPTAGATELAPVMTYAMRGELRFVPGDPLAISGILESTIVAKFAAPPDGFDDPQTLESSMRLQLTTAD